MRRWWLRMRLRRFRGGLMEYLVDFARERDLVTGGVVVRDDTRYTQDEMILFAVRSFLTIAGWEEISHNIDISRHLIRKISSK